MNAIAGFDHGGCIPDTGVSQQSPRPEAASPPHLLTRVRVLEAIRKKLPDVLSRPGLEMVALDYFRRLGHDNHRRISKFYAWEEKKSKASWGGQTVDYAKIATAACKE